MLGVAFQAPLKEETPKPSSIAVHALCNHCLRSYTDAAGHVTLHFELQRRILEVRYSLSLYYILLVYAKVTGSPYISHRKIGIYITCMGVNNMQAEHMAVKCITTLISL